MALFAELQGKRVIDGRIVVPTVGAPHADVTIDSEVAIPTRAVLIVGTFRMICTPWRTVVPYQGRTVIRLIAGAAGWQRELGAKGYTSAPSVRLSLVLGDLARTVGETLELHADRELGEHYIREAAPACRHLNRLLPGAWRIDPADGVTRTGPRASSPITSPFSVQSYNGARGALVVASEFLADFVPARTLTAPTMPGKVITIGAVTHSIVKGAVRTEVLAA